jgi:hypothetical protein
MKGKHKHIKMAMAALALYSLSFFTGITEANGRKREAFIYKYASHHYWEPILLSEIEKYNIWDKYEAYHILRATVMYESGGSMYATEYKVEKIFGVVFKTAISFGHGQISFGVAEHIEPWLRRAKWLDKVNYLYNPRNNLRFFVLNISYFYKTYGNWRAALSVHNIGHGRYSYRYKVYGKAYFYKPFIDGVKSRLKYKHLI